MKNKTTKKKLPKLSTGGFLNKTGQVAENYGLGLADTALSTIGMNNVIEDNQYKGAGADFMRSGAKIVGGLAKTALPMAANIIAPGSGALVSAGQQIAGNFNPEQSYPNNYGYGGYNIPKGVYEDGGVHQGDPNAELEKQEVFQTPNGQVGNVNGPSHEQGGVPVNIPENTQILSDKLKLGKKTFAELGKPFVTKKEDKILADDKATNMAKRTAKLIADTKSAKTAELFRVQEQLKMSKVANYAKKLGVELAQNNPSNEQSEGEYAYGGIHINPSHRGRFTAYKERTGQTTEQALHSSNPHVRQMANFARNASHWKHEYGGLQKFTYGGTDGDSYIKYDDEGNPITADQLYGNSSQSGQSSTVSPSTIQSNSTWSGFGGNPNYVGASNNASNLPTNTNNQLNLSGLAEPIINGVVQNIGNLAYLHDQGKRYDKVNYGSVRPTLLNNTEALRDADIQANLSRNSLKDATNGSVGSYLSNLTQVQASNTLNKARIRENFGNDNAGISNQAMYANQGYKMKGMEDEAANKGKALTNYYRAMEGVGMNSESAYRDYKAGNMNKNMADMIGKAFSDYHLDMNNPNHWDWIWNNIANKK